jgi:hypothetical protein
MDLFHPHALKDMGIHVGKGMAAGAMAGATLDVFTAGVSLGAATLLGAAAGGLWQGADKLGKRVLGRLKGYQEISVDDTVLRLLALRQLALIEALEHRGHAALQPISLRVPEALDTPGQDSFADGAVEAGGPASGTNKSLEAWRRQKLPDALLEARSQPGWSTLSESYEAGPRRNEAVRALAETLARP